MSGHVRTEVAFERTFGSHAIAQLILFGAFLSLLKIFNGNFVAATRMLYAIGRRNLVHPSLGRVHATTGTPVVAIALMGEPDRGRGDVRRRDPGADHRSRIAGGRRRLAVGVRRVPRAPRGATVTSRARSATMAWLGAAVSVGDRPDEGRSRRPGQLHARRVDRVRRVVSASGWCSGSPAGGENRARAPAATNASCGSAAQNLDLLVDHRLRHAGDAIAAREVGELGRFHRIRGDVRVGERHFVREADRPRTVRSRGGREHLHRHRLVDGGDALAILVGQVEPAPPTSRIACTSEMNS